MNFIKINFQVIVAVMFLIGCVPEPAHAVPTEYTFTLEGETYSLRDGCNAYKKIGNTWEFIDQICYDQNYHSKYFKKNNKLYLLTDDGREAVIHPIFLYDVESVQAVSELFITDVGQIGWTAMTLQSPKVPTVQEYVDLRNCLRAGTCDFQDNRLEPSKELAYQGKQSLKFFSVAPTKAMVTAKSSIETQLIHFVKGDDVWYEAWYFLKDGVPSSIMDLESTWLKDYPGPRIWVNEDRTMEIELKALDKPRYKQSGNPLALPLHQWVRIVLHYKLSEMDDGVIELWQDGVKIIDARGKNIPFPDTILNSLEIGITANSSQNDVTLYVDDIVIGKIPPEGYSQE